MRDSQRSKVYQAERLAWEGIEVMYPEVKDVEDYLCRIFRSSWLRKKYPEVKSFQVGDGRARRSGGGLGHHGKCYVYLPRHARTDWVILHELAHGIAMNIYGREIAAHGREYCQIYLSLVRRWIGVEAERSLKANFKLCRVKYVRLVKKESCTDCESEKVREFGVLRNYFGVTF